MVGSSKKHFASYFSSSDACMKSSSSDMVAVLCAFASVESGCDRFYRSEVLVDTLLQM